MEVTEGEENPSLLSFQLLETLLYRVHLSLFTGRYQNALLLLQVTSKLPPQDLSLYIHLSNVCDSVSINFRRAVASYICQRKSPRDLSFKMQYNCKFSCTFIFFVACFLLHWVANSLGCALFPDTSRELLLFLISGQQQRASLGTCELCLASGIQIFLVATEMIKSVFLEGRSVMLLFCIFAPALKIGDCNLRHWRSCEL